MFLKYKCPNCGHIFFANDRKVICSKCNTTWCRGNNQNVSKPAVQKYAKGKITFENFEKHEINFEKLRRSIKGQRISISTSKELNPCQMCEETRPRYRCSCGVEVCRSCTNKKQYRQIVPGGKDGEREVTHILYFCPKCHVYLGSGSDFSWEDSAPFFIIVVIIGIIIFIAANADKF
ncbi:hypothetical protein [Candidatus Uabimicrobium amorphum]|uniref:Uncharacterized protein n=1 Tax=Uabimicrobium amorphum TaxID=2596890 RepID=A0A5S9F5H2_UABAM|nr:hypothetical protein [Candidatus Uabimicrobium amorphum]BBM86855.1 hypothetical protein UABAM_05255 [Candidatus Uabimicrobium amorphum]